MRVVGWLFVCVLGCSTESTQQPGVALADTSVEDATPVAETGFPVRRLPCARREELANDLPLEAWGALEAELVSIVPPGTSGCPSDRDHLHLQVLVAEKRYDVAVTVDSDFGAPVAIHVQKRPPVEVPVEGWATASFDYGKDIGTPSADYEALSRDPLLLRLQRELTTAARVRIYGRSYRDGTGVHNVHRNGRDRDGVILVHRGESDGDDRAIALRFANDIF